MSVIDELVFSIQKKFDSDEFDKFIHSMNFPKYKNFAPGTRIDFRFPITLLVGPNGGGKSSVLHAAWGAPVGKSTSRFWFSTPVDPILKKDQHRYWYTHYVKQLRTVVESRKISGNKRHGYWEPSRPAQKEGMQAMPAMTAANAPFMSDSGDRWTQVDRTPHYFNAKIDSSAFDRFFNSTSHTTLEKRQDYFVRYSAKLKEVIDGNLSSLSYYGVEKVANNRLLTASQLETVNQILQKNYKSARYISHKLYDKDAFSPSVIFETAARSYSECFAGSGELAVVNYVLALEEVEAFDLLLLDEPETSLHPGAQEKFVEHLLRVVKDKRIQVIISTHSPTLVQLLPTSALVVLEETDQGIATRPFPTKGSAFQRLGVVDKEKVTILVEDRLLKAVVDRALSNLPSQLRKKLEVVPAEVGVSEMLSNQVKAHAQSGAKVIMVLDGDQRQVEKIFQQDPDALSREQKNDVVKQLKELRVSVLGTGSMDDLDTWMQWCKKCVLLIDQICPEQVLLELLYPTAPLLKKPDATNTEFKAAAKKALSDSRNETSADSQYYTLKIKLGEVASGSPLDLSTKRLADNLRQKLAQFDLE